MTRRFAWWAARRTPRSRRSPHPAPPGGVLPILRLTIHPDSRAPQSEVAVRCYRYAFNRSLADDFMPQRLARCPNVKALKLTAPTAGPDLSSKAAQQLAALLNAMPSDTRTPAAVSALLQQRFRAPATVAVEQSGPTTVSLRVSYQNACLIGELPGFNDAHVAAAIGTDCRGG